MAQLNDLSRSLTSLEPDSTIIAVIEMSMTASWSGPVDLPNTRLWRDDPRPMASSPRTVSLSRLRSSPVAAWLVMTVRR